MTKRAVQIVSYFSLPTDLAAEMRTWPEFVSGDGYNVRLASQTESVEVELIGREERHVAVRGSGPGELFDRVLGRVVHALAAHSDNLMVDRIS